MFASRPSEEKYDKWFSWEQIVGPSSVYPVGHVHSLLQRTVKNYIFSFNLGVFAKFTRNVGPEKGEALISYCYNYAHSFAVIQSLNLFPRGGGFRHPDTDNLIVVCCGKTTRGCLYYFNVSLTMDWAWFSSPAEVRRG